MRLTGGIVTVRGVRIALVFADPDCLRPGVGDALLARLGPWFPRLPIMLAAPRARPSRAYAAFDTHQLLAELDLAGMVEQTIDLDLAPPDDAAPPF
ncbi:hypothetical protein ABIB42_002390 [Massilia sp. UYP32]|uniref:Uncharacterized protein n=1 Tax=Massilia timonae CCUG 45783 TaxID=883126 RepID=K9DPH7_9BURK|nr:MULTISPECIES: hypothetical protein [Massilia]EKU80687.1 hypothetical protein HMPREF9710_04226 [Massilia timonae CCUG 45783]QYG02254.1 hypothetical protein KY496_02055 [Massilia sp. NP310]